MCLRLLVVVFGFVYQMYYMHGADVTTNLLLENRYNSTPGVIHQKAIEELKSGNYRLAISELQRLAFYPSHDDIYQSSIALLAYAYYKEQEYQACIGMVDQYLQFYPNSNRKDRLLYLKGLAYYNLALYRNSILFKHKNYLNYYHFHALNHFEDLLKMYPESKFASQIKVLIKQLQDIIVSSKLDVAYFSQKEYKNLSAINILYSLLNKYPESNLIPEVLYRIMSIYMYWGLLGSGEDILKYLKSTFPDSYWVEEAQTLHDYYNY